MTPGDINMVCSDIDKKLKNFISDLLSETDYQGFVEHLDSCPQCTSRVRSMGSFTNQLWELGEIEIPSDLDSTILFQFDQAKKQPRKSKTKKSKKLVFGVIILIIGIVIAFGAYQFFKSDELNVEPVTDDAVIIQTTGIKRKAPDPEAERLYNQLKGMAESLAPMTQNTTKKKVPESEKVVLKSEEAPSLKESVASSPASSSDAFSLHWHLPYFTETDIKQVVSTITMLDIDPDYDDKNFIIFKATNKKIKTLSVGIKFTYKIQLDIPEFIADGSNPQGEVVASISFTGREPTYSTAGSRGRALSSFEQETNATGNNLDWHILLVSSQQNSLIDIIHRNRGTVLFTSNEVVIFSMPGPRIEALAQEIQGTGGMFADFGNSEFETVALLGIVNVLVYLPEQ